MSRAKELADKFIQEINDDMAEIRRRIEQLRRKEQRLWIGLVLSILALIVWLGILFTS